MTVALQSLCSETLTKARVSAETEHGCSPGHARSQILKMAAIPLTKAPNRTTLWKKSMKKKSSANRRLRLLRSAYARRGVSPATVTGVTQVSLAGAKRRYVQLEIPCEYDDDYLSDDMLSTTSSMDCDPSTTSSSASSSSASSRVKYVQFATHCSVVEIPHFDEYTVQQKAAMWNGTKTIRAMARRNTAEYQYDGWSVDTAAEEDEFVIVSGESVHPAHAAAAAARAKDPVPPLRKAE